jgi:hypothetical protein
MSAIVTLLHRLLRFSQGGVVTRRTVFFGTPLALAAGGVLFVAFGLPALQAHQPRAHIEQPIFFDHSVHVQDNNVDCLFCHRSAVMGSSAGMPSIQQCMVCHQVAGVGNPEIEKVRRAWQEQKPVDWVRIHRLPDHVQFVHEAHLKAGLTCITCHGDVARMQQVSQVRPLHMADCVDCHKVMQAPTDCFTCHK